MYNSTILALLDFVIMLISFIFSSLDLVVSHLKASVTTIRVYLLAIHYALREFCTDCRENLKFVPKSKLFKSKLEQWRKSSLLLRSNSKVRIDQNEEDGEDNAEAYNLTAVLTGAEGTIGSEILDYLISLDFVVFVLGLNPPSVVSNERIHFIRCDLSARNEVFESIEQISLSSQHIDLVILNAAMMLSPNVFGWFPFRMDLFGERIIEPHLAINVLANAQIFASLSQRLENSKCPFPRAIFLSSCTAHVGDLNLLFKDEESFWCRHLNGYKSYADSKLLLSTYVKHLSKKLKSRHSKITVASVHPGVVPGKLYRNVFAPIRLFINIVLRPFLRSPTLAATRILDLAFCNDLQDGCYYEDGMVTHLCGFDDPEYLHSVGISVRNMIVDCSDDSFSTTSTTAKINDFLSEEGLFRISNDSTDFDFSSEAF